LFGSCDAGQVKETVTYYKAAEPPIKVGSNRTVMGIGSKDVSKGKGLSFVGNNVIVQNIHRTFMSAI
jgi:pectin lyase